MSSTLLFFFQMVLSNGPEGLAGAFKRTDQIPVLAQWKGRLDRGEAYSSMVPDVHLLPSVRGVLSSMG